MAVKVIYRGKELDIEIEGNSIRVDELLKKLDLSPSHSIVIRGDTILNEKDRVKDGETVRVVNAISGGA